MGEVRSCTDVRIGREVALKSIRREAAHHGEMRARFEREARVQGQLEHPSIVPVYDLDLRPDGAYFTMRRVRGETLEQVIARLRDGDPAYVERYSRHRLLSAFAQLAQAIAFAHARGVIHRDLKPSNVMLGDYGEVYALDWGLARTGALPEPDVTHVGADLMPLGTAVGAVIGTPGYMTPEQAEGASEALDPRTDVYALGAILFEILTLEPLHRQPAQVALASTVAGVDARPSARAPQRGPPPEFDAVCARACALDPEARHASARELHAETDLPAAHTLVVLTVAGVALVMVPSYVMGRMYDDRYEVKQRLVTYLWHLRQILPPEARRPEGRQ